MRSIPCRALLIVALVGCGGGTTAGGPDVAHGGDAVPEGPPPPMAYLLPETVGVTHVDVAALRATPYYETLSGLLVDLADFGEESRPVVMDALSRSEAVLVGSVRTPTGIANAPVVARGQYRPDELFTLLRQQYGAQLLTEQRGAQTLHFVPDGFAMQIEDHTWILGHRDLAEAVVARLDQRTPPPLPAELSAMMARVRLGDGAVLTLAVLLERTDREAIAREVPQMPRTAVDEVERFGARLELAGSFRLEAVADAGDPQSARTLSQQARTLISGASGNFMLRAMGVGPFFDGSQVVAQGNEAILTLEVAETDALSMLDRVGGLLELAAAARAEDEAP